MGPAEPQDSTPWPWERCQAGMEAGGLLPAALLLTTLCSQAQSWRSEC